MLWLTCRDFQVEFWWFIVLNSTWKLWNLWIFAWKFHTSSTSIRKLHVNTVYVSHMGIQISTHFTQFLFAWKFHISSTESCTLIPCMWATRESRFQHISHSFYLLESSTFLISVSCMLTVYVSHTGIQISAHFTQYLFAWKFHISSTSIRKLHVCV